MSSRKVEDIHEKSLKKLLSDSGLVCFRQPADSNESTSVSGESVDHGLLEGAEQLAEEPVQEEEVKPETKIEEEEDIPEVFPSPSLRRVLPDKMRKLEMYNRIHVLPEEFLKEIDPELIPRIATTPQQKYIDQIAALVGCTKYKSSLAEFWFLDTMANLLRRAQDEELDRPTQAVLMLWFCEWMKEMQHFDAASRERMLRRFKDNMLSAARYIGTEEMIPAPQDIGVYYKAQETKDAPSEVKNRAMSEKHLVKFEGCSYECSLRDLTQIIHYIFDLFSTDYQYELVRLVFTFAPEYSLIDAPYQINTPKRLYAPLKAKPTKKEKEKSPKKDASNAKGKTKVKKVEADPEDYLKLLALKAKDDRERDEQEEKDMEEWNKRSHILPLGMTAGEEVLNVYWPPPPPEPVVEIVPVEVKGKTAKGKKK